MPVYKKTTVMLYEAKRPAAVAMLPHFVTDIIYVEATKEETKAYLEWKERKE